MFSLLRKRVPNPTNLVRTMSKHPKPESPWPENYETPLANREEIRSAREDQEYDRKLAVPIRSAKSEATASILRDTTTSEPLARMFMLRGRKDLAIRLLNDVCRHIKEIRLKKHYDAPEENVDVDPTSLIHKAVANASPLMVTTQMPVGSVNYTVPVAINEKKQRFYGMKWIVQSGRTRTTKSTESFALNVAREIVEASENKGRVVAKKEELHRVCYQNRAYANYQSRKRR